MRIDLTEFLRKVGNEADFEEIEKVNFPQDGLNLTKPVKVSLHLVNTGLSVLVAGEIAAEAELECSRCLKKLRLPLSVKINEEYSKRLPLPAVKQGKPIELKEEDFVFPLDKDDTLDLDEMIRENLLLALPIQPLLWLASL